MKIKRQRNGIATKPTCIRIDEDILRWAKDIDFNISAFVNKELRISMERYQQRELKFIDL